MKEILKKMIGEIPMKVRSGLFFMFGAICVGLPWLTSCSAVKNYPSDNIIEEFVEAVIEDKTGIDIDLTPMSEE